MADNSQNGHQFLNLRAADYSDRTFLGGMRLSSRSGLFFLICLIAAAGFTALYWHVDREVTRALDGWKAAHEMTNLVGRVDKGLARLRGHEKQFLLSKDPAIADAFASDFSDIGLALDRLFELPNAGAAQKHAATIRDGLAEYDEQFRARIDAERALGISDESGVAGRLKNTTTNLKKHFSDAGFDNLADQVERIIQQGQETLFSGVKRGVDELRKRYQTLSAFVASAGLKPLPRKAIDDLLKAHETDMLAMINARFELTAETGRFDELTEYVAPSMEALAGVADVGGVEASAAVDKARLFARYTIVGGSAAILLWLIMFGLMIIRSFTSPARELAAAATQLASGARATNIPARGNTDSFGVIARALDAWIDSLVDVDHLRQELDRTRTRLEQSLAEAEAAAERAAHPTEGVIRPPVTLRRRGGGDDITPNEAPAEAASSGNVAAEERAFSRYASLDAVLSGETVDPGGRVPRRGTGPIATVSQQLQHFSQYVSAAANDVERTETLIKGLDDANRQLDTMADMVADMRDQTNMLAFRSPPLRDQGRDLKAARGEENLIMLSAEKGGERGDRGDDADGQTAARLDAMRQSVNRIERTVEAVRVSLDGVTGIAQDIASTASSQALDATNKLLAQSTYLQNMLDDIIAKVKPAEPGRLAAPERDGDLSPSDRREPDWKA